MVKKIKTVREVLGASAEQDQDAFDKLLELFATTKSITDLTENILKQKTVTRKLMIAKILIVCSGDKLFQMGIAAKSVQLKMKKRSGKNVK
jgi:hypothetical protein